MKLLMIVGAGSFIGGVLRYIVAHNLFSKDYVSFPLGTLAVNIFGCFFIGLLFGLSGKLSISEEWRLFLATGILGGFTTFSAFSIEAMGLLRLGHYWTAFAYIAGSVLLGIAMAIAGVFITKTL